MSVTTATKTVKKINSQRQSSSYSGSRSVTTERTASGNGMQRNQSVSGNRNDYANGGRRVTINSNMTDDDMIDDYNDYEEIY